MFKLFKYRQLLERLEAEVKEVRAEKIKIALEAVENKKNADRLKDDIEELKHKKEREIKDIEHLVKIAQEKRDIELEKAKAKMEVDFQKRVTEVNDKFHEKIEGRFKEEMNNIKEIYAEIIKRLPNVNMAIDKKMR